MYPELCHHNRSDLTHYLHNLNKAKAVTLNLSNKVQRIKMPISSMIFEKCVFLLYFLLLHQYHIVMAFVFFTHITIAFCYSAFVLFVAFLNTKTNVKYLLKSISNSRVSFYYCHKNCMADAKRDLKHNGLKTWCYMAEQKKKHTLCKKVLILHWWKESLWSVGTGHTISLLFISLQHTLWIFLFLLFILPCSFKCCTL